MTRNTSSISVKPLQSGSTMYLFLCFCVPDFVDEITYDESQDREDVVQQLDGALGDDNTESETDGVEEDITDSGGSSCSGYSRCPICDEPTNMHKTYHLATKHFKDRLLKELPREKPFKCPECEHESKTKINMWTHYLGKHKHGTKWVEDTLDQKQKVKEINPSILTPTKISSTPVNVQQFNAEHITPSAHPQYVPTSYPSQRHRMIHEPVDPNQYPIPQQQQQQPYPQKLCSQQDLTLHPPTTSIAIEPHPKIAPTPKHNLAEFIDHIPRIGKQLDGVAPQLQSSHFDIHLPRAAPFPLAGPFSDNYSVHPSTSIARTEMPSNNFFPIMSSPPKGIGTTGIESNCINIKKEEYDIPSFPVLTEVPQILSMAPKSTTPITKKKIFRKENSTALRRKDSPFWCDLCQSDVNGAKIQHFAAIHFEDRLRNMLPVNPPFLCPCCKHEGKHFFNLSTHFLKQHPRWMDSWTRKGIELLEDEEAIAKSQEREAKDISEDHKIFMHYISSGEETDTSDDSDTATNPQYEPFIKMLSENGVDNTMLKSVPTRRRKRYKSFKNAADYFTKGFDDVVASDSATDQYSSVFRRHHRQSREAIPNRVMTKIESRLNHPHVPHHWLCDGKLLVLEDPVHCRNLKIFQENWIRGQPIIVQNVDKELDKDMWTPDAFRRQSGNERHTLVNTKSGKYIPNVPLNIFWDGFENLSDRIMDENGIPMVLKLKDWPADNDFANFLPENFNDLMRALPIKDYTHRTGQFNLAGRMPSFFVRPDLGPKMYIAYGNALYPNTGSTNLHLDMSDACNVMIHVGLPQDGDRNEQISIGLKAIDEGDIDILTRKRLRQEGKLPGALWHIYHPKDADKIRDLLNKVALEEGHRLEPNTDPIHDQRTYLNIKLRQRLYEEYGVVGYAFPQCEGDVVFIPAGAPHQVQNIHNCIKIAEDFVSPENLEWCFYITDEFRHLSDTHTNHEDKLQIKMILYHAVKDCVSKLMRGNEEWQSTNEG